MVARLLAHIDTLDAALVNLTERIELALARTPRVVELLSRFPACKPTRRRS